jgi:hypothetical protein
MSAYITQEEVLRELSYLENEIKRAKERLADIFDDSPKPDLKLRGRQFKIFNLNLSAGLCTIPLMGRSSQKICKIGLTCGRASC